MRRIIWSQHMSSIVYLLYFVLTSTSVMPVYLVVMNPTLQSDKLLLCQIKYLL